MADLLLYEAWRVRRIERAEIHQLVAVVAQHRQLSVVQVNHFPSMAQNGGYVRRHEHGLLAVLGEAQQERRTVTSHHDLSRIQRAENGQTVRALHLRQRRRHSLFEAPLEQHRDEVRQDFGVGVGAELVSELAKLPSEGVGVLDDAVVNERDLAGVVDVRMSVRRRRRAVRRPPGVRDADHTLGRILGEQLLKPRDLSGGLANLYARSVLDGDAGGIVASVFQPLEPFHEQRRCFTRTNITDYTTHT